MGKTVYDVLVAASRYDGNPSAHKDVIDCLNKHGHKVKMSDAWCTETVMAFFYDAGCIDLLGGFSQNSGSLMAAAKKLKIWHNGASGILPGDIVIFGKNGSPNHSEMSIGNDLDISGNYNGGCARRKRSSHSSVILGYVRPKYAPMGKVDNLQAAIIASDVLIGMYSSGNIRKRFLNVFGSENAQTIQDTVNKAVREKSKDKIIAVACIADHYGKNPSRKEKLGKWADKAQTRINAINSMRGKTVDRAARDVINGNYGTGKIRELLLSFCGYSPSAVQEKVNSILKPADPSTSGNTKYRIHVEHFCRKNESAYGACTAIFQYAQDGKAIEKCVLIDTAMDKTASVVIEDLKEQGVKQIDALFISHAHGDHYGGLTKIAKAFPVKWLYLPDVTELDKYQRSYGNSLRNQTKKVKNFRWYKQGESAVFGGIRFKCLYACKAKDLKEHDSHHYVNNMSPFNIFECGGFIWHTAGDAQNPANNLFVSAMKAAGTSVKCHGLEFHWHTDGNATNDNLMSATKPRICASNYHNPGWHSGRKGPKQKAEAVGAVCYATADDGHVEIDIANGKASVSTSKSGKHDTYSIT